MKTRVAVICGGRSGEHEISLLSSESVIAAFDPARYEVTRFLIDKEGHWTPHAIQPEPGAHPGIDVIFPILHGTFGEDGTVQGLFELADIPYVGANVLASALSMDKDMMKRVCRRSRRMIRRGDRAVGATDLERHLAEEAGDRIGADEIDQLRPVAVHHRLGCPQA